MSDEMEAQVEEQENYAAEESVQTEQFDTPVEPTPTEGDSSLDFSGVWDESPQQNNEFQQQVSELGFEVENSQQAQETLLDSYKQAYDYNQQWQSYYEEQEKQKQQMQQQMQQQAYQMQQMQGMAQAQQQYLAMQQMQQMQQQQPEPEPQYEEPQGWWAPPEFDRDEVKRWRVQQRNPQTGQWFWTWKNNTPKELIRSTEDYVNYRDKWRENVLDNPQEILPKVIEQEFDKLFADRYGAIMEQQQYRQFQANQFKQAAEINQRNADWVYERDAVSGEYLRDGMGQLVMTPEGQQVVGHIHSLRQQGITDPNQLWDLSSQLLAGDLAQRRLETQTQQLHAAQAAQERNMRHLQRGAGYIPNREGSVAPPEAPSPVSQNPSLSPGDKLRQQALSDGLF